MRLWTSWWCVLVRFAALVVVSWSACRALINRKRGIARFSRRGWYFWVNLDRKPLCSADLLCWRPYLGVMVPPPLAGVTFHALRVPWSGYPQKWCELLQEVLATGLNSGATVYA